MEPKEASGRWRRLPRPVRANFAAACRRPMAALAAVMALFVLFIVLVGCSTVALENSAEPALPEGYAVQISEVLKSFNGSKNFTNAEISDLRWVHISTGWNWLICVRYDDQGHRRIYSFFIKDKAIANFRADVVTDGCAARQYTPFDMATGTIRPAATESQPPVY